MTKTITILGSTGSIGRQTLSVADELGLRVAALTAERNVDLMEAQCRKYRPKLAVLADEAAASSSGEQEASASAPQQETGAASSPANSDTSPAASASRTESSGTASSSKQETAGTANSGTEKPASSSGKQEAGYEAEVKALLKQLYNVKARAEAELNSCIAGAKAEFKSLPESQQTQARKISIVLARSGRLYAMQASYDREGGSIVSQMRAVLTANGQSTALADQAMASYKAQKSAMYAQLTSKLYS